MLCLKIFKRYILIENDRKSFLYILCWGKNLYLCNSLYILSINNIVNYSISSPTFIAIFYY
ncbi:hypothetical protein COK37_18995 [Bacillus thuringiensis]|nr:hypothetical protein CN432_20410 [Bacillus thuringiensis]PFF70005.1 hypothetical protein CN339_28235 [Bacillus thuringiensis]PFR66262.1 hypothetical protein COK37_18995 [Bacillus thuringiensis]PFT73668.1 hypothetical protein COK70_30415 [Bacillus thuringiensis]PFV80083.1 hypothetical protein COL06_31300 [Bacillus thuringiensis]